MTTVTAAIIRNESKILIARRSSNKHLAGFWEFPGGKLEENETAEECLIREIKEELGITVHIERYFMENIHQYGENKILLKAFFCKYISGDILLNDHDKINWVDKVDLEKYQFAPADIPFIKALNEQ